MARPRTRLPEEFDRPLTPEELNERRRRLSLLSPHHVADAYRQAYEACRMEGDRLPRASAVLAVHRRRFPAASPNFGAAAHLPVIAMTAHATAGYKERCLGAGMDGFITKPIGRAPLLQVLAEFQDTPKKSTAGLA